MLRTSSSGVHKQPLAWLAVAAVPMLVLQTASVSAGPILNVKGRAVLIKQLDPIREKTCGKGAFNELTVYATKKYQFYEIFCNDKKDFGLDKNEGYRGEGQNLVKAYEVSIKKAVQDRNTDMFKVFSTTENRVNEKQTPSADEKIAEAKSVACQFCGASKTVWNDDEITCQAAK